MLASPPVRNMATVGGNVAAPSSFRDLFTVLLAMDAQAVLQSLKGKRTAALEDLLLQDGRVDVKPNEIIAEIFFDDLPRDSWCSFGKVGRRLSFHVPLVSLALFLRLDANSKRIKEVRSWFNHLRESVPERPKRAEAALRNEILDDSTIARASQALLDELQPVPSFKASSDYKRRAAARLFEDQLGHCAEMILAGTR